MHTFAASQKICRQAGRDPPVLLLFLKKNPKKEQQIDNLLLSFSIKETKLNFVSNLRQKGPALKPVLFVLLMEYESYF